MKDNFIIAIDGHSSTGKSSLSKIIAKKLHYTHIDSGAMYRVVTLFALNNQWINEEKINTKELIEHLNDIQIDFRRNPETHKNETFLNGENVEDQIRSMEVSSNVSAISTIKEVRDYCVFLQREMSKEGGIVMDGRDIGTVVFPDANLKFFITASAEIRAKRRFLEYQTEGKTISFEDVLMNVNERDRIDSTREIAPLKPADDAIIIDNSNLDLDQTVNKVLEIIKEKATE